jgi:DNA-binding winged helix-turn-helix (wHTH) protein
LRGNGQRTVLQEQQLKVLLMLIEREGEIAMREEIQRKLWPNDTNVEFDFGINSTIKKLRTSLGDSAQNPQYIETIAR